MFPNSTDTHSRVHISNIRCDFQLQQRYTLVHPKGIRLCVHIQDSPIALLYMLLGIQNGPSRIHARVHIASMLDDQRRLHASKSYFSTDICSHVHIVDRLNAHFAPPYSMYQSTSNIHFRAHILNMIDVRYQQQTCMCLNPKGIRSHAGIANMSDDHS
eukprot:TRINITY_DN18819_c0_g1_i1.p2 TRINITY_DN18819_c0_g1~~TRINITY_DN18819_c0_g1_i1.p2  ORF type:complete len:158 (-),score=7.33 TRINITY_DN18819_c0_g1_i1:259-732(-)